MKSLPITSLVLGKGNAFELDADTRGKIYTNTGASRRTDAEKSSINCIDAQEKVHRRNKDVDDGAV